MRLWAFRCSRGNLGAVEDPTYPEAVEIIELLHDLIAQSSIPWHDIEKLADRLAGIARAGGEQAS